MGKVIVALAMLFGVWAGLIVVSHIDNIPKLTHTMNLTWNEINRHYTLRTNLIPRLVVVIKQPMRHEKEILDRLTQAYADVSDATIALSTQSTLANAQAYENAQARLDSALADIFIHAQHYPKLQTNHEFQTLQTELLNNNKALDQDLKRYKETAKAYNRELTTLPGRWIASLIYPRAAIAPTVVAPIGTLLP